MNGNGLATDSFNSGNTNFSTRGRYDPVKASTNGDVAVLYGTLDLGNHTVAGNVYLGPTAILQGYPSQISGKIITDFNYDFPNVAPPDTTGWFTLLTTLPGTAPDGNSYTYVFTNSVNYIVPNLSGSIYVGSNATVRLLASGSTSKVLVYGGGLTNNAGSLTIYMASSSFSIGGSGGVDGGRAANLSFYSLPSCTTHQLFWQWRSHGHSLRQQCIPDIDRRRQQQLRHRRFHHRQISHFYRPLHVPLRRRFARGGT